MLQTISLVDELRALRAELEAAAPLIEHPVVQARLRGEFTLDQIRAVELQHYYEAQHFSGFVLNVIKKCDADREARKWMIDNFVEEASGDEDHAELILILLDELGVARQQAYAIEPTPGVVAWREILEGLTTRRSFLEAMAPFMLEAVYPPIARALYHAYVDRYQLAPAALRTYVVHDEGDQVHGSRGAQIVERHLARAPEQLPLLKQAMKDAYLAYSFHLDGYWQAATGRREYWSGVRPLL
jgi:pyrroloquinoline quinone (PQQ) biosynthesis protein C